MVRVSTLALVSVLAQRQSVMPLARVAVVAAVVVAEEERIVLHSEGVLGR